MTQNKRRLIRLFIWITIGVVCFTFLWVQFDSIKTLRTHIINTESKIMQLKDTAAHEVDLRIEYTKLNEKLSHEEDKIKTESRFSADFGSDIKSLLSQSHISPLRYQTVQIDKSQQFEFAFSASALSTMNLLYNIQQNRQHWTIPYISIHAEKEGISEVVMRFQNGQ